MTHKIRAALAVAIILWASAFVGIRAGLQDYSPEGLALLRYLVASVVMSIVYFNLPVRSQISLIDKLKLLSVGAIGIGFYNLTLNHGEVSVASGVASFITSQSPVITTIFAVMFLGETLTLQRVLGFLISMAGVTFIAYGEIGSFHLTVSMMYVLAALLSGSCYSIMQKPFLKKYHAIDATTYVIWGGTLFLLSCYPQMQHDIANASWTGTMTVVYLGIFPASLAYVAWSYVLQNLSVSHVVSYLYVMPFAAALLGWMLLGETPAAISVIGAVISIAGVWLVNQSYQSGAMPEIDVDDEPEPDVETA
jgi:drug/metabolite transporter (DMT)-like permease